MTFKLIAVLNSDCISKALIHFKKYVRAGVQHRGLWFSHRLNKYSSNTIFYTPDTVLNAEFVYLKEDMNWIIDKVPQGRTIDLDIFWFDSI